LKGQIDAAGGRRAWRRAWRTKAAERIFLDDAICGRIIIRQSQYYRQSNFLKEHPDLVKKSFGACGATDGSTHIQRSDAKLNQTTQKERAGLRLNLWMRHFHGSGDYDRSLRRF